MLKHLSVICGALLLIISLAVVSTSDRDIADPVTPTPFVSEGIPTEPLEDIGTQITLPPATTTTTTTTTTTSTTSTLAPTTAPPTVPTTPPTTSAPPETVASTTAPSTTTTEAPSTTTTTAPVPPAPSGYRAQECGWVADELRARNVREDWVQWLVQIANRESHCCPNIQGGDRTDANCNVTHVARWDHRSDTGLFMLNGVHWKTEAGILCPEITCDQQTLLNNVSMQFDGMISLLLTCGKRPWTAPNYGCAPLARGDLFNE